jgi:ABC-type multidrug transport system ATPase subunit
VTPEVSEAPPEPVATLEFREASFRRAGQPPTASLSLRSLARRVGLIGQWEPLFQALTGDAQLSSGSAWIFGCELELALARGVVGFAPCDPPLPASFSVREYLEQAAQLSHGARARATHDARRMLEEYGLAQLASQKLGQLLPYQRRALGIALAALTAPPVLCLEAPLRDLDASSADYVARLCAHAAEQSLLLVSVARPGTPSAERTLLEQCDELFLLQRGVLVAHGSPQSVLASSARYLLTLVGARDSDLVSTLTSAGCQVSARPSPTTFSGLLSAGSRVTRYLVELPAATGSPDLLLDTALEAGVTVLELEPFPGAQSQS